MNSAKLIKDKRHCTSVFTDIRNFSKTFKDFQNDDSYSFLDFIKNYYSIQNQLAKAVSDKNYISSHGDGFLAIFLDKEGHDKKAYAYILATHRILGSLCEEFIKENPGTVLSFGMGADSGNVWKVGDGFLRSYVGTVINRASRIESSTKSFGKARTAIGNSLYTQLVKEFYPLAYSIMEEAEDYDDLLDNNPETVAVSRKFMLRYVYDMELKGIQTNAPFFRLSESLVKDDRLYWQVMDKLIGKEKVELIKKIFKNYD